MNQKRSKEEDLMNQTKSNGGPAALHHQTRSNDRQDLMGGGMSLCV